MNIPIELNTSINKIIFISIFITFLQPTSSLYAANKAIIPEPIPPGFDFPAPRQLVQQWADERNVVEVRNHAWKVWEGMSQNSKVKADKKGQYLPIWETWFSQQELFPAGTKPISLHSILKGRKTPNRKGKKPRQFGDHTSQIVSFNKFNPTAGVFINAPHLGPDGIVYYYLKDSLQKLNKSWPKGTPLSERSISEFPLRSMETKPVFMLVKQNSLTAVPYWQGPLGSTDPTQPTPDTWTTCVLFDPTTKKDMTIRPATPNQINQAYKDTANKCNQFLYASLSQIYSYQLKTKNDAIIFNNEQIVQNATKGDYAVLVAMHINTKEIVNWTWQTFFWSGGESPPNNFPGHMSNQPDSLKNPWNNYAMCTAYWQENLNGSVKTCFNPYLETATSGIPDGLNSNCMSCHGIARTQPRNNSISPNPQYPRNYIRRNLVGPDKFDSFYFKGNTRTDFSWAIGGVD